MDALAILDFLLCASAALKGGARPRHLWNGSHVEHGLEIVLKKIVFVVRQTVIMYWKSNTF